ncbi:MAG: Sll0939 protein, partial [uncultured Nocardioides sp.]
ARRTDRRGPRSAPRERRDPLGGAPARGGRPARPAGGGGRSGRDLHRCRGRGGGLPALAPEGGPGALHLRTAVAGAVPRARPGVPAGLGRPADRDRPDLRGAREARSRRGDPDGAELLPGPGDQGGGGAGRGARRPAAGAARGRGRCGRDATRVV